VCPIHKQTLGSSPSLDMYSALRLIESTGARCSALRLRKCPLRISIIFFVPRTSEFPTAGFVCGCERANEIRIMPHIYFLSLCAWAMQIKRNKCTRDRNSLSMQINQLSECAVRGLLRVESRIFMDLRLSLEPIFCIHTLSLAEYVSCGEWMFIYLLLALWHKLSAGARARQ
jgi:hypothetical protein